MQSIACIMADAKYCSGKTLIIKIALQSLYLLQVCALTTDNCLAEVIANFAQIRANGFLMGIVVILHNIVDFPANLIIPVVCSEN